MKTGTVALLVLLLFLASLASCVGGPAPRQGSALSSVETVSPAQEERARLESLIMIGSPASLAEAVQAANQASLMSKADARSYAWLAYEIARLAYPELTPAAGLEAPPETALSKAFIDARNGRPAAIAEGQSALFELMPLLTVFRIRTQIASIAALAAYERFAGLGHESVLAELARGHAQERNGNAAAALASFSKAQSLAADCYPAAINASRLLVDAGKPKDALAALSGASQGVRETQSYQRAYAYALYGDGRWAEALPLITRVLLNDPLDSRFMLMRAHLLVERGEFKLAASLLDAYASVDPNDKLYILLRARSAAENSKDLPGAIASLRRGLERYPEDQSLLLYAAELLFSGGSKDRLEAITYAGRALKADPSSIRAFKVLLAADLAAGNGAGAAARADSIRSFYPDYDDYESLYRAYRLAGRVDESLAMARLWREKQPSSEQASLAWATLLLEQGRRGEASAFISAQLALKGGSVYRSNLFLLQSRLQPNEEAALSSLRSSLIENGLNIDALVAMTDIYMKRNDLQRARFYLKQALTLSPDRADIAQRRDALVQLGVAIP
jgi:predicted Zn-dependent protease